MLKILRFTAPLLFALAALPARAEENDTQAYVFAVTRVFTYVHIQGQVDGACKERFAKAPEEYNSRPFAKWKKRNDKTIAEVVQHMDALPQFLGSVNSSDPKAEEQQISSVLLKTVVRFVTAINDPNIELARKVCGSLATDLASPDADLEKKYPAEMARIHSCKDKKICTHLIPI